MAFPPKEGCNDQSLSEENYPLVLGYFSPMKEVQKMEEKSNINFCGIDRMRMVVWVPLSSLIQRAGLLGSGTNHRSHPREQPALITFMPIAL